MWDRIGVDCEELWMAERILALSHRTDFFGGGEHSFFELLTRLSWSLTISAGLPGPGELSQALSRAGVSTTEIAMPRVRPWRSASVVCALHRLLRHCRQMKISMIYANSSRSALYGGIAAGLQNIPLVWHCRIAERDRYLDRLLLRLSTVSVANSRATAMRFQMKQQGKIRVVYNGVDLQWLRDEGVGRPASIPSDWKILLVPARLSREKRHDLAISLFEQTARWIPGLHLVSVGASDPIDEPWWHFLKTRAARSPCASRIHWIGGVPDIRPWYRAADLVILASENEPFGRVLVEAMASGVPVAAAKSGGCCEIIRNPNEGILFEPADIQTAAQAVAKILSEPDYRRQVVQCAGKRAEDFSLQAHVDKMLTIFREALRTRNACKFHLR